MQRLTLMISLLFPICADLAAHELDYKLFPPHSDFQAELALPMDYKLGLDGDAVDLAFDINAMWQFRTLERQPGGFGLAGIGLQLHHFSTDSSSYWAPGLRWRLGGGYRWAYGGELIISGNVGFGAAFLDLDGLDTSAAFMTSFGAEVHYQQPISESLNLVGGLGLQGRSSDHDVDLGGGFETDVDIDEFYPTAIFGLGYRF